MFLSRQTTTRAFAPALIGALPEIFTAQAGTNAQEAGVEQTNEEEVVAYPDDKDVRIPARHNVVLSANPPCPAPKGHFRLSGPCTSTRLPSGISDRELKGAGDFDRRWPVKRSTRPLRFGAV